jgi:hypothetical protein
MIEVGQIKVIWCDLKYVVEFEDKKKKKKEVIKMCKLKDKQQNDQKRKDKQQNQLFFKWDEN